MSWQQHQWQSLPSQPWAHSPIARWQLWFGLHYKNSCKIEQDLTLRLRGCKKASIGLQGITYLSRPYFSEAGGPRKRKNDDFIAILKWWLPHLGCQIWRNVTFSGKSPEDFANRPLQVTWLKVLFFHSRDRQIFDVSIDIFRELFEACKSGDVHRVRSMVDASNVNARDTAGRRSSPLHFAAGYGRRVSYFSLRHQVHHILPF